MAINIVAPPKSKKELAEQLGVSRQSLYYIPKMNKKDLAFKAEIETVMTNNKAYGHKRIAIALEANKKKVLRVMKLFNLKPQRKRKAPFKPEDINQTPMDIPNLIKGTFIDTQNQVWVTDFTYLPYFGRFVYLATAEDFFTREVIGWAISTKHDTDLVTRAMLNALKGHNTPKIAHSDQGSEYSYYNKQRIHTALKCAPAVFALKLSLQEFTDIKMVQEIQRVENVYNFIQQKNQQLAGIIKKPRR